MNTAIRNNVIIYLPSERNTIFITGNTLLENIPTATEIVQNQVQNDAMETHKNYLSTAHLNKHLQKLPSEAFFKKRCS